MIIDMRRNPKAVPVNLLGGTCRVDGMEVPLPWFVDTEAGVVKSYDVCGDRKAHAAREYAPDDAELIDGEVWSRTLQGKVELFRADGSPWVEGP